MYLVMYPLDCRYLFFLSHVRKRTALGVQQKSALFMLHRIRLAMQTGSFEKPTAWSTSVTF